MGWDKTNNKPIVFTNTHSNPSMKYYCSIFLGLLISLHTFALSEQQTLYLKAKKEFGIGDYSNYAKHQEQLRSYVLWPYLEYAFLHQHFNHYPVKQIQAFLHKNQNTWLAKQLHSQWLNFLGENKIWHWYEGFYQASDAYNSHRCLYIEAQLHKDDTSLNEHLNAISSLWLKPFSLPKQCDSLFKVWQQHNAIPSKLAWQRFEMSYSNNNTRLAHYLMRFLNDEQKVLADELMQAERYADVWLERIDKQSVKLDSGTYKRLLRNLSRHGFYQNVSRLIQSKPPWLSEQDLIELRQVIAWHYARESGQQAIEWVNSVEDPKELQSYQLRYAMQDQNWPGYLSLFEQSTPELQNHDEWRYWYAIAQIETGHLAKETQWQSKKLLEQLAKERSFYGFLAAEQQQQTLAIKQATPPLPTVINREIQQNLAVAVELFVMGELVAANQEWSFASRNFNPEQWIQAGLISQQVQWHDKTIQAFAKAQLWDAIEQRFPLAWQTLFEQQAEEHSIEHSWLLAMARQESGFSERAHSPVGALGVLQLMPKTARQVASKNNISYQGEQQLYEAELNIQLGSLYLKQLLEHFDHQYILATAAYNAGPHRVEEWLEKNTFDKENWAHWVATIPFPETRQYVQNILTYSLIYQHLLGEQATTLSLAHTTTAK